MKISKEIKVGLTVLGSLALFYYGYNYLKGSKVFQLGTYVYAKYSNINGLEKDSPILLQGYKVGKVSQISYESGSRMLTVELHLMNDDIDIPMDSKAMIVSSSLLGGKEIHIDLGRSNTYLGGGDTIGSGVQGDIFSELGSTLEPFEKQLMVTVQSLDSVLKLVQVVLDEQNRQAIASSLQNLNGVLTNLNSSSGDVKEIIAQEKNKISRIMTNLDHLSANMVQFTDTLKGLEIKATIEQTNESLYKVNAILSKVEQGEGTVGQLIHNDTLYQNMENATENLDKLLIDLRENPGRYVQVSVFGKKDKTEKKKNKKN